MHKLAYTYRHGQLFRALWITARIPTTSLVQRPSQGLSNSFLKNDLLFSNAMYHVGTLDVNLEMEEAPISKERKKKEKKKKKKKKLLEDDQLAHGSHQTVGEDQPKKKKKKKKVSDRSTLASISVELVFFEPKFGPNICPQSFALRVHACA